MRIAIPTDRLKACNKHPWYGRLLQCGDRSTGGAALLE